MRLLLCCPKLILRTGSNFITSDANMALYNQKGAQKKKTPSHEKSSWHSLQVGCRYRPFSYKQTKRYL